MSSLGCESKTRKEYSPHSPCPPLRVPLPPAENVPSMAALMYLCVAQPAWGAVAYVPAIMMGAFLQSQGV